MDAELLTTMANWLWPRTTDHAPGDIDLRRDSILWHIAERLEREGYEFHGCDDGGFWVEELTSTFHEKHPTKAEAVIAAFEHHTRSRP